uniref:Uncharacterized protein n=1 Tax=Onchocerca volvulus TaxID=6282 RepID=A0A8R1XL35_ONCVO
MEKLVTTSRSATLSPIEFDGNPTMWASLKMCSYYYFIVRKLETTNKFPEEFENLQRHKSLEYVQSLEEFLRKTWKICYMQQFTCNMYVYTVFPCTNSGMFSFQDYNSNYQEKLHDNSMTTFIKS